jgi:hypothetical protein
MTPDLKASLRSLTLELRRELEEDMRRRLAEVGLRPDREPRPADETAYRTPEDRAGRGIAEARIRGLAESRLAWDEAVETYVREAAYTWANRLLALRCMEARDLIDEVILQKEAYGGRSLQHHRMARRQPERCSGEDDGLFAVLFEEFNRQAEVLPVVFNPRAPLVALRPSVAALKRCIGLLSGEDTEAIFSAPDALGWAYQYWNINEKALIFERVRTERTKIEGADDIIPATCIYTESYIARFLVQNSLGAFWAAGHPGSGLPATWDRFVHAADRNPAPASAASQIAFLDPCCGSGHFLLEAFDLFYQMYREEGLLTDPAAICASILEHNLHGIDIDERAIQIAALALFMKAREKAPGFVPRSMHLAAANIRLPAGREHLERFLKDHPDDRPLKPALDVIFDGLARAAELGSLLQVEEPLHAVMEELKQSYDLARTDAAQRDLWPELDRGIQGRLPLGVESFSQWRERTIGRLREHFEDEATTGGVSAFFGEAGSKGLSLVELLSRRYEVVATNPPYMGSKNMGKLLKGHVGKHFTAGKRDLYAAFILRCLQLATQGGRIAMVTQQSWMFLRSFADLRALDEEKLRKMPQGFKGVLRETTIESLAHLGPHAFSEIGGEVVNVTMFVMSKVAPPQGHRLTAFRLIGPRGPQEKEALLDQALRSIRPQLAASEAPE